MSVRDYFDKAKADGRDEYIFPDALWQKFIWLDENVPILIDIIGSLRNTDNALIIRVNGIGSYLSVKDPAFGSKWVPI